LIIYFTTFLVWGGFLEVPSFEITDTQKDTIEQSTTNMFESLCDAIVMSTIVVFLFLASFRQILVILVTIPLVYASTIALMWLVGIEFNVVTLTAIILALGLLLDDTVVVMENIERHYRKLHKPIKRAVMEGTKEIMFADLSGTVTTMIALALCSLSEGILKRSLPRL